MAHSVSAVALILRLLLTYSGRFDRDVYDAVPADPYGSRR